MLELFSQIVPAARRLWRSPGFALLSILTLAVGIGANTAVFSLVDAILLRPLPYPQADRLVGLWHTAPGLRLERLPQSPATYLLYRKASHTLADIAVYREVQISLTGGEEPERLPAAAVSPSLARLLGVAPARGRAFTAEEGLPGAAPVVLLGDGLWRRRFGADPGIVGRTVRLEGVDSTIIGVLPAGLAFPEPETALWIPLPVDAATADLGQFSITGIGRLAAGASVTAAQKELEGLLADLPAAFPGSQAAPILAKAGFAPRVHPFADDVVGDNGGPLWILLGAVGCVLLIAAVNVANLLLVRGEGRRRETAIQLALGAPRRRLTAAVLAESLLLGLAAGALGLGLAGLALRLLVRFQPIQLPRLSEVGIDGRVLAFTAAVSLLTTLLFGLLPALRATGAADLLPQLKGGGRAVTAGRERRNARQILVGLQVALALVLLTGSGILLHSFLRLARIDPGFAAERVLTLRLALPAAEFPDDGGAARFFLGLAERLASLPGVEAVGAVSALPLSGRATSSGLTLEDFPREPGAPPPVTGFEHVAGGYFEALGIPLKEGRYLTRADQEQRTGAVVVSAAFARHFWPQGSAVGKRLRPGGDDPTTPWYTIVGVVGDVRNLALTREPGEILYLPILGQRAGDWTIREMNLVLRAQRAPAQLAPAVRREIRAVAPNLPVASVEPMTELVERARARYSFTALMLAVASAVALLLGGVGVYGFVSYRVGQRTPEIGVRMAIGARPADIRRMVLREVLAVAAAGLAVGLAGAVALSRGLRSVLFEVSPLDPLPFAAVPLLLVALVFLASHLPARRAARTPPGIALQRSE